MLRAIHFPDRAEFLKRALPGSFTVVPSDKGAYHILSFFCPCGCGLRGRIRVGAGCVPKVEGPAWEWNSSRAEPSLNPSVSLGEHWHGWLKSGYWHGHGVAS